MKRIIAAMLLTIASQGVVIGQQTSNKVTWKNDLETRKNWFTSTVEEISNMDVEINKPIGFSDFVNGMYRFPEMAINVQDLYSYCLINKDSSIYIGFSVYHETPKSIAKTNLGMRLMRPDWLKYEADSTWMYHTRYSADKNCSPVKFYDKKLKSVSNFDDIAEYHRIEKDPLLSRFYIYKTITYHIIDGGFISVSYFNLEKTCIDKKLDNLIKNNRKIVRFKPVKNE